MMNIRHLSFYVSVLVVALFLGTMVAQSSSPTESGGHKKTERPTSVNKAEEFREFEQFERFRSFEASLDKNFEALLTSAKGASPDQPAEVLVVQLNGGGCLLYPPDLPTELAGTPDYTHSIRWRGFGLPHGQTFTIKFSAYPFTGNKTDITVPTEGGYSPLYYAAPLPAGTAPTNFPYSVVINGNPCSTTPAAPAIHITK